ncbi:MAG TPA: ATP-binding protein [Spirochaetota bacterium]|nr:ATP-binding protein [Spirochaetota bacterium]HOK92260.1 ATP-binding protein [Spirochaetota bacterium]HON16063.1 ATP-binding protein [Spirochaetota bacterium]HPD79261.1 ATP-binding protein [Spirochaetota bacterium]HPP95183.1 ATP-binding protein [Spirochaetota bacterium]
MWITRQIEYIIPKYLREFPVLLITGARQVGKTSLLKKLFPDYQYITLDDPIVAARVENSPEDFFASLKTPVIIDEAQYAPSIFRYIKIIVDKSGKKGQFLITGSQIFSLMQNLSESLAGRCGVINLHTLSMEEIKQSIPAVSLGKYIERGGFPALHSGEITEANIWYSSYISTYIERDVRNILSVSNLRDFTRFMRILSLRTGQILSLSGIANDVGVAPNTVKSWLSVLQASGHIYLLEPYYNNMGKRIAKTPKIYFCDTGLALHLMGITSWDEVEKTPIAGAIWETYIFNQIHRYYINRGINNPPLWFWRSQSGHEVDFLIEKGGKFIAIESKLTGSPDAGDYKNFYYLQNFYGKESFLKGIVACKVRESYPLEKNITAQNFIDVGEIF